MSEPVEQAAAMPANLEAVIKKYIELRDAKDRADAEAKAKAEPLQKAMKAIETFLMDLAIKTGQTKFGTPDGTAFITTKTGCNVADWDATLKFIEEKRAFNLLNRAVNKTAVGEFIEANGAPPPGINWVAMKEIQIRRS